MYLEKTISSFYNVRKSKMDLSNLLTNLETMTLNELEAGNIKDYFDQKTKDQQILIKNLSNILQVLITQTKY